MFSEKFSSIEKGFTYDDVLLVPQASTVEPKETGVSTTLTKRIELSIPVLSSAMDTVSERDMAIALSRRGGLTVLHRNMPIEQQAKQVREVKESGFIIKEVRTVEADSTIEDVRQIMSSADISGLPVLRKGKLAGIITYRDVRFCTNQKEKVDACMVKDLVTVGKDITMEEALKLMQKKKVERLPVIDGETLVGIITEADIRKELKYKDASRDSQKRLIVAAATGPFDLERAKALDKAEADLICIDVAHAHNLNVVEAAKKMKKEISADLMVGNIATAEAAEALISAGADVIKVGIGPGSICTTRIIAGVGVPQLTAVAQVADVAKKYGVSVVADGGIRYSGDIAKAIAAGADAVMLGNLLAGTEESPGTVLTVEGRKYKSYRGMGSLGAMASGLSSDRYFQSFMKHSKFVPEGVEGLVPYKGNVDDVMYQLIGGLKSAMGYTGAKSILELQKRGKFLRITSAGMKESHPHDIMITNEAPNYPITKW